MRRIFGAVYFPETQQKWNNELAKIEVESISEDEKKTFYTALYHTLLSPIVYEDVDGNYRGLDQNIHLSEGFTNYTILSLGYLPCFASFL